MISQSALKLTYVKKIVRHVNSDIGFEILRLNTWTWQNNVFEHA